MKLISIKTYPAGAFDEYEVTIETTRGWILKTRIQTTYFGECTIWRDTKTGKTANTETSLFINEQIALAQYKEDKERNA